MYEPELRALRLKLLKGGIAPKYAARAVRELRDHYHDIRSALLEEGVQDEEAGRRAAERLGDVETIAAGMLSRPELLTFGHRFPGFTCLLMPTLGFIAVNVSMFLLLGGLINTGRVFSPEFASWPVSLWLRALGESLVFFSRYCLTPLLAAALVAYGVKRHLPGILLGAGLVILAFFGSGLSIFIHWPTDLREMGSLGASWGGYGFILPTPRNLLRMAFTLAFAGGIWGGVTARERQGRKNNRSTRMTHPGAAAAGGLVKYPG